MHRRTEAVHEKLPAHPSSVGAARRLLRSAAGSDLPDDVVDTAELLVSEVVTNAVVHAGTPVELRLSVIAPKTVLVEVSDGSPHQPVPRRYADTAGTGRGLLLVEELADRWGVTDGEHGKTVWFCLSGDSATDVAALAQGTGSGHCPPEGDCIRVELRNVPLLLHAQWQQHATALMREYLLLTLDVPEELGQVLTHAACSDAVALLDESVPEPSEAPDSIDGESWCPRVVLCVPRESVPHFATLDETLDLAVGLASSEEMLTPPTNPAMQSFRRWVCGQVLEQAEGGPPTPWSGT